MRKVVNYNNPTEVILIDAPTALDTLKKLKRLKGLKGKIKLTENGHAYHLVTDDNVYSCIIEGSEEWEQQE